MAVSRDDDKQPGVFKVSDLLNIFAALDQCDADADDVASTRKAARDTIKGLNLQPDVVAAVHKLRKMPLLQAQAWIENFNLYCEAAGLNVVQNMLRDVDPNLRPSDVDPNEPVNLFSRRAPRKDLQ